MPTTVAKLEAVLSAKTADFDRAMDRSQGRMNNAGKVAGIAGAAIAGGLVAVLHSSVKQAMEAEQSQARLAQAFTKAHLSIKPYSKAIEAAEKAAIKLGFSVPNPFGDGAGPPAGALGPFTGPASISPRLYDEMAGAKAFGLTLTSGYRPGARTKRGTKSDHSYYPSRAIDEAGSPANMARFFKWLIGQTDVKQAFYDPLGSIFNGVLSSYREGGHSDHVHVATYDQGGWLRPGWNLAYNGLGRPEPVGGGVTNNFNFPNYVGSKTELMSWLQNAAKQYRRQNGRGPF